MLVLKTMQHTEPPFMPPQWSEGTDAEIVESLRRHYDPDDPTDVTKVWSVGDERVVHLSAISSYSGLSDTQPEQDIVLVLMNIGGKELVSPIGEITECAFVVGQKDVLSQLGEINTSSSSSEYWDTCKRRYWCNNNYKNAIPSTLVSIFKEFKNVTTNASYSVVTSNDYFALPAEKEVQGSISYSNNAENVLSQFKHYNNGTPNKIKYWVNPSTGIAQTTTWWSRSKANNSDQWCFTHITGNPNKQVSTGQAGIAPFGCI